MSRPVVVRLRALGGTLASVLGAILCAGSGCARPSTPPDHVERIGALELITHFRAERGGDAAGFAWRQVAHWSLRWRDHPVRIDTLGGIFGDEPRQVERINAVFLIDHGGGIADLLINVGDPNNTSAFHLVSQHGDTFDIRLLCIRSGGDNSVGWAQHMLRLGEDESLSTALPGRPHWHHGPRRETLNASLQHDAGGRYLMLGRRCLFDAVAKVPYGLPAAPADVSFLPEGPVIVSPGGSRLVRLGQSSGSDHGVGQSARLLLLVTELTPLPDEVLIGSVAAHSWFEGPNAKRAWQQIEIDRLRMRYASQHEVDASWLLHHFRWMADVQGESLVERDGFAPLPHRGRYVDRHAEYHVDGLSTDRRQDFVDFLVREFGGEVLPQRVHGQEADVRIGAQVVTVTDRGFFIASSGRPYVPGEVDDPAVRRALVRRLGEAFDAELASGRLDDWFVLDPASR